jgi:DNA-binding beta-propeller fold protein YncE
MNRHTKRGGPKGFLRILRARLALVAAVMLAAFVVSTAASASTTITVLSLQAKDLVYDPVSQRIYASVPSSAGLIGNSITVIDPFSHAIGSSTFVGSEPNRMAISDDSRYIYVGLDGAGAVRRFDVPTLSADIQFSLGVGSFGPRLAEDIAVQPNDHDVVAVSLKRLGVSPRHDGVAAYRNGIQFGDMTQDHTGSNVIEFSDSPSILYGYNNETTEFGFRTILLDESGLHQTTVVKDIISGFGVDIEYDAGLIYSTSGRVIDPVAGMLIGTYGGHGRVEPDSTVGRVFFIDDSTVRIFDQDTFLPLGTISVSGMSGDARNLIRWGQNGLAFSTTGGQVVLIQSSMIPEPGVLCLASLGGLCLVGLRRRKKPAAV